MKIQKNTWILIAVTALLGGFVYFYEIQGKNQQQELQIKKEKLFNHSQDDIQKINIVKPKETLIFERTKDVNYPWRMTYPARFVARAAPIDFLLDLLVEGKSDRRFNIPLSQAKEFGFDPAHAQITIILKNREKYEIILGKTDFEDKFIYAQINPPNPPSNELQVNLIDKSFFYAIERDLQEWK